MTWVFAIIGALAVTRTGVYLVGGGVRAETFALILLPFFVFGFHWAIVTIQERGEYKAALRESKRDEDGAR